MSTVFEKWHPIIQEIERLAKKHKKNVFDIVKSAIDLGKDNALKQLDKLDKKLDKEKKDKK